MFIYGVPHKTLSRTVSLFSSQVRKIINQNKTGFIYLYLCGYHQYIGTSWCVVCLCDPADVGGKMA